MEEHAQEGQTHQASSRKTHQNRYHVRNSPRDQSSSLADSNSNENNNMHTRSPKAKQSKRPNLATPVTEESQAPMNDSSTPTKQSRSPNTPSNHNERNISNQNKKKKRPESPDTATTEPDEKEKTCSNLIRIVKGLWAIRCHLLFVLWNLKTPFLTAYAAAAITGIWGLSMSYPKEDLLSLVGVFQWVLVGVVGFCLLTFTIGYLRLGPLDWWNLSIKLEIFREMKSLAKGIIIPFGVAVITLQCYFWLQCSPDNVDCFRDKITYNINTIPIEEYRTLQNYTQDLVCPDLLFNWTSVEYPSNATQANLDNYMDLKQTCYTIQQICKKPCSEISTKGTFCLALISALLGLFSIATYNGPVYEGIPEDLGINKKIKLPILHSKMQIPIFWTDASEILRCVPLMAKIHQSSTSEKEFEALKEQHDDLPWEMIEDITYKQLKKLHVLLPRVDLESE